MAKSEMKLLGRRVCTGRIKEGTYQDSENLIQIFDGKFDTGYKIVSFKVAPSSPTVGQEIIGKLSTTPKSSITLWKWDDDEEVAWAHWGTDKYQDDYGNVRDNTILVEDFYISTYNETLDNQSVNYEIILEKYDLGNDWTGALAMVKNKT